jgi:hypothetical protein
MPTPTYTALATVTLASTTPTITFSNIPATYRDLVITITGTASADSALGILANGSSANFIFTQIIGNGSAASVNTVSSNELGNFFTGQTSNIFQIMDYSTTDKHKQILSRVTSLPSEGIRIKIMRWQTTAAINSVGLSLSPGTFQVGTTASLYGIVA